MDVNIQAIFNILFFFLIVLGKILEQQIIILIYMLI